MAGYTRADTANNISNGSVVDADDLDAEFNSIEAAFNSSTGHTHDGTSAEGSAITVTGPSQEYVHSATALTPKTNNTYDLGSLTNAYKDIHISGVAYLADIDLANLDSTIIGATTPAAITGTTVTATTGFVGGVTGNVTGNVTGDVTGDLTGNADTATALETARTFSATGDVTATAQSFDGTGNVTLTTVVVDDSHNHTLSTVTDAGTVASQDADAVAITGGAVDGTVIGGTTPAAGAFTSLTYGGTTLTATAAELNTLDGITATVTELNYSDGVTSNIQTQLDAKQPLDADLTALAGLTSAANKVPYFTGSETAGLLDFVDEDDMASDSATAVPSQQSVKAYVDGASPIAVLEETDLSSIASYTISLDTSSYVRFEVVLSNVIPASNNQPFWLQTSVDDGDNFDSGASDYSWVCERMRGSSNYTTSSDGADTVVKISEAVGDATRGDGLSGTIHIINPQASTETTVRFEGEQSNSTGVFEAITSRGRRNASQHVNAIKLIFNSGNIASGKIIVYGYKGA